MEVEHEREVLKGSVGLWCLCQYHVDFFFFSDPHFRSLHFHDLVCLSDCLIETSQISL